MNIQAANYFRSPKLHLTLSTLYQEASYQSNKTTSHFTHPIPRSQLSKPQNYPPLYPTSIKQLIVKAPKPHFTLPTPIKELIIKAPKTKPHSIHLLSSSQLSKSQNYTSLYPPSIKHPVIKAQNYTPLYPSSIK